MLSTAIDASAVARVLGIKTEFVDLRGGVAFLPQRIAVVGQGNTLATYSGDKRRVTSALEVANRYGFGSPLHLAVRELFPANGDGVGTLPVTVYPLQDDAAGVAAAGDITATGTATEAGAYRVVISGVQSARIVLDENDDAEGIVTKIAAAINAVLEMPVTATADTTASSEKVDLAAKWKGASGNDIFVEVDAPEDSAITFAVTQPVGGLNNPDVQPALDQIGGVWETMILNCLNVEDTDALDAYSVFGEGRWGALERKPLIVFTGTAATTPQDAIVIPDARKTDRVNVQLPAPGSPNLPLSFAARQLARIAVLANNNPPHDYGGRRVDGITPGTDAEQWDYPQRDLAVQGGSSTVEVRDGVIHISDVVTFFHPTGDPTPAYRYVVDVVRLQNTIFNIDLKFKGADYDGVPFLPDDQPTVNPSAKSPKVARADAGAIVDALGAQAILSDPETAKAGIRVEIDGQNSKRWNMKIPVQLSGNSNIRSIDLDFGFFFGG